MPEEAKQQEVLQMKKNAEERAILGKVAEFLVKEQLINIDEEIRFLALLREED